MFAIKEEEINNLVAKELEKAIVNYGVFNSNHEKYAVIKEELEEAEERFIKLKMCLDDFWNRVKANEDYKTTQKCFMRENALNCVIELIQVLAMIDKPVKQIKEQKND